jgi:hypothetical protein
MQLNFGKYRGERLEDIPTSYLQWLATKSTNVDKSIRDAAVRELIVRDVMPRTERRRSQETKPSKLPDLPPVPLTMLSEIVAAGRRSLAFNSHPDRGGDQDRMKAINIGADWLERYVAQIMGGRS